MWRHYDDCNLQFQLELVHADRPNHQYGMARLKVGRWRKRWEMKSGVRGAVVVQ